nr:ATP-binding protein [uncultured Sutterella sp.]
MESTRSIGYSLPAAVADLIDNSIAAEASCVEVWTPTTSAPRLMILDDGTGMDMEDLHAAMRYGSRFVADERRDHDLGRFGLGLKMASLSQCRSLTVVSKKAGGELVGARWDLDHIAASNRPWALQILEAEDLSQIPWREKLEARPSGTLVLWEKLDVMLMGIHEDGQSEVLLRRMQELKDHLALVFHRYLAGEADRSFRILFNDDDVKPADPFLEKRSQRPFAPDSFRLGGRSVVIEPFILPHPNKLTEAEKSAVGDLKKEQGFYIYRNKRLVIWGTWFRLSRKFALSKLARVKVDIPASVQTDRMWSLDVKKSSAVIPEELRDALRKVVEKLSERSGNVWRRRARVEKKDGEPVWIRTRHDDKTVGYVINDANEIVSVFVKRHPDLRALLRLIETTLPLDALYSDLDADYTVDAGRQDVEEMLRELEALGIDTTVLKRGLKRR